MDYNAIRFYTLILSQIQSKIPNCKVCSHGSVKLWVWVYFMNANCDFLCSYLSFERRCIYEHVHCWLKQHGFDKNIPLEQPSFSYEGHWNQRLSDNQQPSWLMIKVCVHSVCSTCLNSPLYWRYSGKIQVISLLYCFIDDTQRSTNGAALLVEGIALSY